MFCVHHDEADAVGVETVPCPFCGFGTPLEESYPEAPEADEDSHDALVKAMALGEEQTRVDPRQGSGLVNLRHYW